MNSLPNTPDLTKVQILAGLMWAVSQAVAYGWLKHAPNQEVLSGSATVIALGFAWADAHLRGKRAIAHSILNSTGVDNTANVDSSTDTTAVLNQPLGS